MENLLWIVPLIVCPLGMLLMAAAVWVSAKLGLRSSQPSEESAGRRAGGARSTASPEAA